MFAHVKLDGSVEEVNIGPIIEEPQNTRKKREIFDNFDAFDK